MTWYVNQRSHLGTQWGIERIRWSS